MILEFFDTLRLILVYALLIAFFISFVYIGILVLYNFRRNQSLESYMAKIVREGRANAVKNKMGSLYFSENSRKLTYVGKIIANSKVKEDKIYEVFVVKTSSFSNYKFIKTTPDMVDKFTGDITLKNWNYILDNEGKFYIENNLTINTNVKKGADLSVDVLSNLSPMVQKAILSNPIHRIRLREKKLIKLPTEDKELGVRKI